METTKYSCIYQFSYFSPGDYDPCGYSSSETAGVK